MKSVVVTGASTGLGYAITQELVAHGIQVFGSVRHHQDASRLQAAFGDLYQPLIFDVTDAVKVQEAAAWVKERLHGTTLWGLVNNAGMAVPGPLLYMPIKDFEKQLDVNLTGQLQVIQAFAPLLGTDPAMQGAPGKIINIGSVAGKMANPFLGAYAASKHGLEALSDALRVELMPFGIDVVIVGPGAVTSEIWRKSSETTWPLEIKQSVYHTALSRMVAYMQQVTVHALPAIVIGKLVYKILCARRPRLRYAPVPRKWLNWYLPRLVPKRVTQWLIARYLGLLSRK